MVFCKMGYSIKPLYSIVMLNTQRFGVFVSNIGAFCCKEVVYNTRKHLYYKSFRVSVFF